jgi:BNR/Asp-box repeat
MRSLAFVAALLFPAVALANGRPPITNGVHFQPGDNQSLYIATTFGLLVSHDDGESFRWICEQNIGYGGTFDPKYRIATNGTIFATTFNGLRVSRDGGCTFTTATADKPADDPGQIADRWIDAIDIGPTGDVWVATADSGRPNNVLRSTDNGVTFEPRGMLSPAIWWKSIAIAPTRSTRIYVTGYQVAGTLPDGGQMPPTAHFEISDDDGLHWAESPLAGVAYGPTPLVYVVGVDHTNPDVVFMSSSGANPPTGDRLYRSTDGGMTWTEVLATGGAILDLAIGPTGTILVATLGAGSFQSSNGGAAFSPMMSPPQLACVGQRADGAIFGCGANWEPDNKAVAKSTDGTTWSKVFRFVELAGPVECPAGTPQQVTCGSQWPSLQEQFGATGPTPDNTVPKKADGGCCDASDASPGELGALGLLAAVCFVPVLRRRRR